VAFLHALLVVAAFVGVAVIPCALGLLVHFLDAAAGRFRGGVRRGFRRFGHRLGAKVLGQRWWLVRIAHTLRVEPQLERSEPSSPPIQQVAADLRRLSRQRLGIATRSRVWFTAVHRAYDDRLQTACGQLGIEEHLAEATGMDLDLERLRVEGLLEAAGLAFRDDSAQSRDWQR
jgi:hypothetical protein